MPPKIDAVVVPAALIGRYIGPGGKPSHQRRILRWLPMYYLAFDVLLTAAMSLTRGLLVNISCTMATASMFSICLLSFAVLLIFRPLISPMKNITVIILSALNVLGSVVLLAGVIMSSTSVVRLAITINQWTMTISTGAAGVTVLSLLLKYLMSKKCSQMKRNIIAAANAESASPLMGVQMQPIAVVASQPSVLTSIPVLVAPQPPAPPAPPTNAVPCAAPDRNPLNRAWKK